MAAPKEHSEGSPAGGVDSRTGAEAGRRAFDALPRLTPNAIDFRDGLVDRGLERGDGERLGRTLVAGG